MPPDEVLIPLALAWAAALGLIVGSFINVVAYRLPHGKSVVTPRSACPRCGRLIRWYENIPVLSWVMLRARCAGCKGAISVRYPLVELINGAVILVACWSLVTRWEGGVRDASRWAEFAVAVPFLGALLAASLIDIDLRILPNSITKPGMVAGPLASAFIAPYLQRDVELLSSLPPRGAALLLSLTGVLCGWGLLRLIAWGGEKVFRKEAMGLGDTKFMGMIGGFVGPLAIPGVLLVASLVGSVVGIVSMVITKDRYIPFGPFLAIGGAATFLFWRELQSLFGALAG